MENSITFLDASGLAFLQGEVDTHFGVCLLSESSIAAAFHGEVRERGFPSVEFAVVSSFLQGVP